MRRPRSLAVLTLGWALLVGGAVVAGPAAGGSTAPSGGRVSGRLTVPFEGADIAKLGPIVAWLEPVQAPDRAAWPEPPPAPRIRQKNARFRPAFAVVSVGQSVEMSNDDFIFHNVFSYSRPNHFDLGIYPAGESRFVTFRSPGVVKTYCSIHENMNATIFVAPTPFHAVAEPDGSFSIEGVPEGRYALKTWSEKLPSAQRMVSVRPGQSTHVALRFGSDVGPVPAKAAD